MNLGVLIQDNPVAGSSPITFVVRNPSGDWTNYQPDPEPQYSQDHLQDSMACVSYSATHCLETQIKFLTGQTIDLSERFLAKMSGTTTQGNYLTVVAGTIKKYGMVTDADWPEPVNFTWDSYYATIPPEVIAKGQEFLKEWDVDYEFVPEADVAKHLQQSPLQVIIIKSYPYHAQELLNTTTVFDTYQPWVKPVDTVHDYFKLVLTKKMTVLTLKEVEQLQALEGYSDPAGAQYWVGKTLDEYLAARLPDKIKTLQASL